MKTPSNLLIAIEPSIEEGEMQWEIQRRIPIPADRKEAHALESKLFPYGGARCCHNNVTGASWFEVVEASGIERTQAEARKAAQGCARNVGAASL